MGFLDLFKKRKKQVHDIAQDLNLKRAQEVIKKYAFDFSKISKDEIKQLLETEINCPQSGSAEYIRVLCGYLYCIGDEADVTLLEKAKYGISMDVGSMIDSEWIESLKTHDIKDDNKKVRLREQIIADFVLYYGDY